MTGRRDDDGNAPGASPAHETWPSAVMPEANPLDTLPSEREPSEPASRRRPAGLSRELGGGRFELVEHLGAGSMGVVYAAYDRQRRERVALKTLQNLEATSIKRLKEEFRSLASVAHPNLVRLRELFADADEVFFTMELVEGHPLSTFLQTLDPMQRGELHTLRNAFRQLAEGLGAVHAHGKIHRDLKPSNVMVRNDGRVVVLDFGVTCDIDTGRAPLEKGSIAGTPAYMAPEQVLGQQTTTASDWYAFGTMLYEALTGRLPFDGALLELLNAKTSGAPLPIDDPLVPADLRTLALELLSRAPESRPRGAEVRARLGAEIEPSELDSRRPLASGGKKAEFVGREAQLRALEAALYRTLQGELVTVMVSGASGIGKTTLVKEFLEDDCVAKGALVLQSKCFEQEFVRYNAFDGVIDGLQSHLKRQPADVRARLAPRHAGALASVFPTLEDVLARNTPRGDRLPAQPGERRRMAFHALREFFGRIAEVTPVVMFLDDLQWGDSDSARLLAVLLAEPDPPPLLIVAACRSDEREASPLLRTLSSEGKGVWNPIEIEVSPLPREEATHLVSRLLGNGGRSGVESIVTEAGGNPFFLLEMALATQERAHDVQGEPLSNVIATRVAHLPEGARELLELVALAERPIAVRLVERASPSIDADAGLLALKRAKLVRSVFVAGEALIQCYHDRIRETIKGRLEEARAASLHGRIAEVLEAEPATDPEQLAEHFHRCGNADKTRRYARLAGDAARTGLAFARAARWYGLAFELSPPDDAERKHLRVDLAEALENAGHAYPAAEQYLAAAAEEVDADRALDFRRRAAGQLLGCAHTEEGLSVLETVLSAVGLESPRTNAGAVASLVWDRIALRLRGLAFEERPATAVDRAELFRIDAVAVAAAGYTRCDFLRGAVFACKELRLALEAGEITRIGRALGSELLFVANEGVSKRERVASLRDMATDLMSKIRDERVLGYLGGCCGASHLLLGDSVAAAPELAEAEALLARGRPSWELTFARGLLGLTRQIRGALVDAEEAYAEWLADARERSDLQAERYFAINRSFGYLGLDQADQAHDNLVRALAATEKAGNDYLHFAGLHAFVLIANYRHEGPEVFERLAKEHQAFWRSPLRGGQLSRAYVRVYLGYCALSVAAQRRPSRRELRTAHRIASQLFAEKARYAEGHAHLIRAAALHLEGSSSDAAGELALGADAFDELGQELQAGAARYQLGRLLGGEEGETVQNQALEVARRLRVRNPVRMYEAYTPGFWP